MNKNNTRARTSQTKVKNNEVILSTFFFLQKLRSNRWAVVSYSTQSQAVLLFDAAATRTNIVSSCRRLNINHTFDCTQQNSHGAHNDTATIFQTKVSAVENCAPRKMYKFWIYRIVWFSFCCQWKHNKNALRCGILWCSQFVVTLCDKWFDSFSLLRAFYRPIIIISDRSTMSMQCVFDDAYAAWGAYLHNCEYNNT